jgi:hypothetical protein
MLSRPSALALSNSGLQLYASSVLYMLKIRFCDRIVKDRMAEYFFKHFLPKWLIDF